MGETPGDRIPLAGTVYSSISSVLYILLAFIYIIIIIIITILILIIITDIYNIKIFRYSWTNNKGLQTRNEEFVF